MNLGVSVGERKECVDDKTTNINFKIYCKPTYACWYVLTVDTDDLSVL